MTQQKILLGILLSIIIFFLSILLIDNISNIPSDTINDRKVEVPYTEIRVGRDLFWVFEWEGHEYMYNYTNEIPVHTASCNGEHK